MNTPPILLFNLQSSTIRVSKKVTIKLANGHTTSLTLKGIIYLGNRHFVIRFIDSEKQVWFHDGITTGEKCEVVCSLSSLTEVELKKLKNATAVMAVYIPI